MNIRRFAIGSMSAVELGLTSTFFVTSFTGVIILPFYLYLFGAGIFWEFLGILACLVMVWSVHSYRMMRYARRSREILSLPGFFSYRFGGRYDYIRVFSAIEIIVVSMIIMALILKETGVIFQLVLGISEPLSTFLIVMIIAGFMGAYGVNMSAKLSFARSVFTIIAITAISLYMISTTGVGQLVRNMMDTKIVGSVSEFMNIMYHDGEPLKPEDYVSLVSMGLLASGMPFFLGLFFAAKDARAIIVGRRVMVTLSTVIFMMAAVMGGVSRGYLYPNEITNSLSRYICLMYEKLGSSGVMGKVMAVIFMILVLVSFTATLEGAFGATIISVYEDILRKGRLIRVSRKNERRNIFITSLVVGFAVFMINVYMKLMSISVIIVFIGALGCSMAPAVLLAFTWKRMNRFGCMAGLLAGLISVPFFKYAYLYTGVEGGITLCDILGINSVIPSMLFTIGVIVLVSLVTPKPEEEIVKEFMDVKNRITE